MLKSRAFVLSTCLVMAACQSVSAPPRLTPQPTVPVSSGTLAPVSINESTAPPAGTTLAEAATDPNVDANELPALEGAPTDANTQIASAPTPPQATFTQPNASGPGIDKNDLIGGWTMTSAGTSCQLFLSLTTWQGGHRATARNCPNQTMGSVQAWQVQGRQVLLKDASGTPVATLFGSSDQRYDGRTTSGEGIAFFR